MKAIKMYLAEQFQFKFNRPFIGVDFDKTLYTYTTGYKPGVLDAEPSDGAEEALKELTRKYPVVIFTARTSKDHDLITKWLKEKNLLQYISGITNVKYPRMLAFIDDRAVHFTDWKSAAKNLLQVAR